MNKLVLLLALFATPTWAEHPKPPYPVGAVTMRSGDCTDQITKEEGQCVTLMLPSTGEVWTVFAQNGEVKFIRKHIDAEKYEELWTAHDFGETF